MLAEAINETGLARQPDTAIWTKVSRTRASLLPLNSLDKQPLDGGATGKGK